MQFKERNHLKFVKLWNYRETDIASAILAEHEPRNAFILDEAELVYCATLDGNFVCTEEDHDWLKKSKERIITISWACEKHRLLVIDKSPKLRCFKTSRLLSIVWVSQAVFQRQDNFSEITNSRKAAWNKCSNSQKSCWLLWGVIFLYLCVLLIVLLWLRSYPTNSSPICIFFKS